MKNTFATEIILPNEPERLEALKRYRILGTYAEKSFKNIAQMVSDIFDASLAMVSLIDAEEVHFGSNVGMDYSVGPRGESFCSLTILKPEVNVIEDALEDPIVANNPLVCGDFGLRFYAGAPLITHDGFMIGTVCLIDTKPRKFTARDRAILEGMATQVMEQIELRLQNLNHTEHLTDINNQLEESNKKLVASEQRFQTILDNMAEGVGIIDLSGKLIYANIMAQRILGLTLSQINDRTYNDPKWQNMRLDGSPLPDDEHPMAVMMRLGKPVLDHEIGVQPPDREKFYISINAAPLFDPVTHELTGGIGTFMDVTARRKILEQKDEFINLVSHELRTPVTSLKAAIQIISKMRANPRPQILFKMIDQSERSLDKLTGLIDNLLYSNRISQGQLRLRKTEFNLGNLLLGYTHNMMLKDKHELIIEGSTDIAILADEQQIDQVLTNLLNNAVKYAPESNSIHILVAQNEEEVKISIRDNGDGIAPDQQAQLFNRYYKAASDGFHFSGLGLGLYISSEIIKKHGGKIGVESSLGNGATFWFTLPRQLIS